MVSTMEVGPTPGLMAPATQEALATTSKPCALSHVNQTRVKVRLASFPGSPSIEPGNETRLHLDLTRSVDSIQ